jgi:predicted RNase H-like nuclease (RuvC/YqgF family)
VEKIRRSFNAVAYTPRHDRTIEEKWELTKAYGTSNDHERDALAAALDAYRQYRNKFQNISKRVPPGIDLDEVRAGVVRGKSIEHILDSREKTALPAPPAAPETEAPPPSPVDERVMELDGLVKRLRGYIDDLSSDVKEKDREIERLTRLCTRLKSGEEERMRRDVEIVRRDAIIKSQKNLRRKVEKQSKKLLRQVSRLKRFADLQMNGDHIPVKVLDSLTRDAVRSLDEDLGINEGDIIAVAKTDGWGRSVLEFLRAAKIRVIIAGTGEKVVHDGQLLQACSELELPFIPATGLDLRIRGRTGTVPRAKLEEALLLWESDFEAYRREKKTEMLESIFREYRSEREREVRRHG